MHVPRIESDVCFHFASVETHLINNYYLTPINIISKRKQCFVQRKNRYDAAQGNWVIRNKKE